VLPDIQQDILESFVDRGQLRHLREPTLLANGKTRPRPETGSPAAAGAYARTRSLLARPSRRHLLQRRDPSRYRCSLGRTTAEYPLDHYVTTCPSCAPSTWSRSYPTPPLPAHRRGLSDLPRLPQALRENLRAVDQRHHGSRQGRQAPTETATTHSTHSTVPSYTFLDQLVEPLDSRPPKNPRRSQRVQNSRNPHISF